MTNQELLLLTARRLVADEKGILAADESTGTIARRLAKVGVASSAQTRRDYRALLFTAPEIENYLSGVILYDETLRQNAPDGTPFPQLLAACGILPGIKVDAGAQEMALFPGEKITAGLDGLRERLAEYTALGARFAKWRAVITIGDGLPTATCIEANANSLARYAALCQEAGVVPIVEPEVLMDGDHSIERCQAVTEATLRATFVALVRHRVALEGMLLKPNMVLAGQDAPPASVAEVARRTVQTLCRTVPAAVPGIVFLSGGQNDRDATARLNAMNASYPDSPWVLSFSFARALQNVALETWRGDSANIEAAQQAFVKRARLNHAANAGTYDAAREEEVAA